MTETFTDIGCCQEPREYVRDRCILNGHKSSKV
jgi:hypothetical protein